MYNSLKAKWSEQPSLAANQHFPKFRHYLERGGKVALDYIAANADLVETVLGGPDKVADLKAAIAKRHVAAENQMYFVGEAKRLEAPIKAVLRTRYNTLKGYCEENTIPWASLTPENILPATRRAAETGSWEQATAESEAEADTETAVQDSEQPNTEAPESEGGDEAPEADGEAAIRARIADLHNEGLSKTEIWTQVRVDAAAIGWTRTAVWACVDELIKA